jgi:hypothetical protein
LTIIEEKKSNFLIVHLYSSPPFHPPTTLTDLLKLKTPQVWIGRPVKAALK